MDLIQATRKFNLAAGRTEDQYDSRAIALHLGLQLEELAETLSALVNDPNTDKPHASVWPH
jgi:hypothetical protein